MTTKWFTEPSGIDVPYEYREAPTINGLKLQCSIGYIMNDANALRHLMAIMCICLLTSGCLGLAMQREIMEGMRDPVITIEKSDRYGWDYTFDSSSDLNAILYSNETSILFDGTVSKLVIEFRAQFPYSSQIEDAVGNETNEYRYVEVRLWQPGQKVAGGSPFWEVKATQDYSLERFTFGKSDLISGQWDFEVEARGYGVEAPIDQLSFHDHFEVYATITKPCVQFPETQEGLECTFISELES
jgi:hypothetical protein